MRETIGNIIYFLYFRNGSVAMPNLSTKVQMNIGGCYVRYFLLRNKLFFFFIVSAAARCKRHVT